MNSSRFFVFQYAVIEPSFHKDSNERECNLPPMVIITPETNIYRRVAVIHTTPEDSFMEIGCDYGITVDRIRRSLKDGGNVPKEWNGEAASTLIGEGMERNAIVSCLGIDKSIESIDIATGRYVSGVVISFYSMIGIYPFLSLAFLFWIGIQSANSY